MKNEDNPLWHRFLESIKDPEFRTERLLERVRAAKQRRDEEQGR
jgi:hypothetical protein